MVVGGLNWAVTAVRMLVLAPAFVFVPDLIGGLLTPALSVETVYAFQVFVYALVALATTFYTLSFALPRCFPALVA